MKKVFELDFRGRKLVVEVGELAKQASSSCLVRYGDTVVLTAVTNKKEPSTGDFFPLMVLYQEKQYSVGKITFKKKNQPKLVQLLPLKRRLHVFHQVLKFLYIHHYDPCNEEQVHQITS